MYFEWPFTSWNQCYNDLCIRQRIYKCYHFPQLTKGSTSRSHYTDKVRQSQAKARGVFLASASGAKNTDRVPGESKNRYGWKRPTGSPSPTIRPSPMVLTKPCPSTQHPNALWTLPGSVTPPPLWAAHSSSWSPFQRSSISQRPAWIFPGKWSSHDLNLISLFLHWGQTIYLLLYLQVGIRILTVDPVFYTG